MVSQIRFKNFKIFRQWQTLELCPITILIGKNNSGKSAVAKLPTMIAPPLKGEPLNWKNKVGDDTVELGTYFADLVYNRNKYGSIELGILNENTSSKLELAYSNDDGILEYKLNGAPCEVTNSTKGFLIDGNPIEDLFLNIDYIGAIRIEPEVKYEATRTKFKIIGTKGQNAYPILIEDSQNNNEIMSKVSNWYEQNLGGWQVKVDKLEISAGLIFEIQLAKGDLRTNIRQTGQGIQQALPLIVRSYMPEKQPTLIIIEEPETHLHPAAHGVLAQRFAESCLEDSNKKYLIETHSQNFVLRMRRLVAEGKLKPEDLAIYYVEFDEEKNESNLRRIKVDEGGGVDWWPKGVFGETSIETRAIYNSQLNDLNNASRNQ